MTEIICYHHIKMQPRANAGYTHLTVEELNFQLDYFQQIGTIIHPNALGEIAFKQNKRQFLLTFDDALAEHFSLVMPALKSRGLSAVFFINSMPFTEKKLLNVHRIQYLLMHFPIDQLMQWFNQLCKKDWIDEEKFGKIIGSTYPFTNQDNQVIAFKTIINFCLTPDKQDELLSAIFKALSINETAVWDTWYMKEHQIAEMVSAGMCIGAHGHSHHVLSGLAPEHQFAEIKESVGFIKQFTNEEQLLFCYPYGYQFSYNHYTLKYLEEQGIKFAFTTVNKMAAPDELLNSPLELPRLDCIFFPSRKAIGQAYVA